MKNYSFSNIAAQDSYNIRKSNDQSSLYRHSELKVAEANSRIEEIKKKYDTPTRRERIESLNKSRDLRMENRFSAKEDPKQNSIYSKEPRLNTKDSYLNAKESHINHRPAPTFGGNHLKESFAVNRIQKDVLKNDINSKELDCIRNNEISYFKAKDDKENSVYPLKSRTREDQEVIFSKVRQMKQSILHNDYMRGSINPRSSVSSANYQIGDTKQEGGRHSDTRVENIDKINAKIKQILSCLAEGQKNQPKLLRDSPSHAPLRESSLDVGKIQNTRASYLKGERPGSVYESNKQSKLFGKRMRQGEESFQNYKNNQSSAEKLQIQFKKAEDYNKYKNVDSQKMSSLIKGEMASQGDKNIVSSFNKPSRQVERPYRDYSVNKLESNVQRRGTFAKEQELVKTPSYLHSKNFEAKAGLGTSQSRSQIDSIKKSNITDNEKSDVLKSGKKLNDQISKIQKKIEEFQAQKKKLNIQFTPFSMKNRSSSNLAAGARFHIPTPQKAEERKRFDLNTLHSSNSAKDNKFGYNQNRASENINITREKQFEIQQITKNTSGYGEEPKFTNKEYNFELKLDQVDVKTVRIDKNNETNEETSINASTQLQNKKDSVTSKSFISSFDEAALRKRTDEGILERKKRLQSADEIIKTDSLKKLISLFCEQAKLDQNFRNMKIWLESNFSKDKYATISKILSQSGLKLSLSQCETLFKVQQSEHNPFFTKQGFDGSFESVCKAYIQAKSHWQSKIKNKFDRQNLKTEGFTVNKIDLERKGYIELQDLVRLLNIESGTFYRNRDMFLIFRRFTRGDKVNFQEILREISI